MSSGYNTSTFNQPQSNMFGSSAQSTGGFGYSAAPSGFQQPAQNQDMMNAFAGFMSQMQTQMQNQSQNQTSGFGGNKGGNSLFD